MIDWNFEDRLIERIDARRIIADRLTPRQRRCLARQIRHGETLKEIGAHEGCGGARVGQIVNAAMWRLLNRPTLPPVLPQTVVRAPTMAELAFDRAAFLEHMRQLQARRERAPLEAFARERRALDDLLGHEAKVAAFEAWAKPQPPPPTIKYPKYVPPPYVILPLEPPPAAQQPQKVEPWFDLSQPLTYAHLRAIGQYAMTYFVIARRPMSWGIQDRCGHHDVRLVCHRNADAIAGALMQFARDLTPYALLSAMPPAEAFGATVDCEYVGMRIASLDEGRMVSIEITWDVPHGKP